jgi:hypothetical protein
MTRKKKKSPQQRQIGSGPGGGVISIEPSNPLIGDTSPSTMVIELFVNGQSVQRTVASMTLQYTLMKFNKPTQQLEARIDTPNPLPSPSTMIIELYVNGKSVQTTIGSMTLRYTIRKFNTPSQQLEIQVK